MCQLLLNTLESYFGIAIIFILYFTFTFLKIYFMLLFVVKIGDRDIVQVQESKVGHTSTIDNFRTPWLFYFSKYFH